VHRGLARNRHPDERRVERECDERADGQAEALAANVDGDDGDPGGKPAKELAQTGRRGLAGTV
jgi:hypothetical protein